MPPPTAAARPPVPLVEGHNGLKPLVAHWVSSRIVPRTEAVHRMPGAGCKARTRTKTSPAQQVGDLPNRVREGIMIGHQPIYPSRMLWLLPAKPSVCQTCAIRNGLAGDGRLPANHIGDRRLCEARKCRSQRFPQRRKWLHQHRERHLGRLLSTQDRLDDVRRQQGQPQDATHIGFIDFLGGSDLRDGRVRGVLQLLPPSRRCGRVVDGLAAVRGQGKPGYDLFAPGLYD